MDKHTKIMLHKIINMNLDLMKMNDKITNFLTNNRKDSFNRPYKSYNAGYNREKRQNVYYAQENVYYTQDYKVEQGNGQNQRSEMGHDIELRTLKEAEEVD